MDWGPNYGIGYSKTPIRDQLCWEYCLENTSAAETGIKNTLAKKIRIDQFKEAGNSRSTAYRCYRPRIVELVRKQTKLFGDVAGTDTVIEVKRRQTLLNAALQGLNWPHRCKVGSCGTCRCVLTSAIKLSHKSTLEIEDNKSRKDIYSGCQ